MALTARLGDASADEAADQRMRTSSTECRGPRSGRSRRSRPSGPRRSPAASTMLASMMPVPIVSRDMQAEEQEGDEVEERRPHAPHTAAAARASTRWWRSSWRRRAARSGNRTAARCAIRPISTGRRGPASIYPAQTFSMTMPLISLATSSKRSTTFSSSLVDLAADHVGHRRRRAVRLEQRLAALFVEVVGRAPRRV